MRIRQRTLRDTFQSVTCKFGPTTRTAWSGTIITQEIRDVDTPSFTRLQKCGEFLPLNPVVIQTDTYSALPVVLADMDTPNGYGRYPVIGDFGAVQGYPVTKPVGPQGPPYGFGPPEPDEDLIELVVNIARSNAVSEKWDVLTALAEAASTARTLRFLLSGFWKKTLYVAELAHLRFRSRRDRRFAVRDASDWFFENWLLARYGIRPIIYDIQSALQFFERLSGSDDAWVKGRSRQGNTWDLPLSVNDSSFASYVTEWSEVTSGEDTYRSASYLGVDFSTVRGGLQIDPFVTAWELVPFSFILDWVVDIGGWLSTLTPQLRGEFLGTQYSVKRVWEYSYDIRCRPNPATPPPGNAVGVPGHSRIIRRCEQYIRAPENGGTYPAVNLRFDFPKFLDILAICKRGRSDVFKILNRR